MVEVCFSSPQRVNWSVAAERGVWLAVLAGAVVVSAGGTAFADGTATAPAGTATTRTGEALPPLRLPPDFFQFRLARGFGRLHHSHFQAVRHGLREKG